MKISHRLKIAGVFTIFLSLFVFGLVAAQSDDDATVEAPVSQWLEPINLSRSGGATDPQLVVDANGVYHALWRDEFVGFAYASATNRRLGRTHLG